MRPKDAPIDAAMTKIVYNGPPQQVCHELAEHTGGVAELEPGATFEVPDEFANRLLASSAQFAPFATARLKSRDELKTRAAELGLTLAGNASNDAYAATIAEAEATLASAAEHEALKAQALELELDVADDASSEDLAAAIATATAGADNSDPDATAGDTPAEED